MTSFNFDLLKKKIREEDCDRDRAEAYGLDRESATERPQHGRDKRHMRLGRLDALRGAPLR